MSPLHNRCLGMLKLLPDSWYAVRYDNLFISEKVSRRNIPLSPHSHEISVPVTHPCKAWDGPPSVGPLGPLGKGLFCPTSAKGPPGPQARRGRVPAASPCYHGARPTKTNKVNRILHTVTRYFSHFSKIHGSIRSPPSAALPVVPPDAVVQGWLAAMGLGPHMVDSRCVRTRALV